MYVQKYCTLFLFLIVPIFMWNFKFKVIIYLINKKHTKYLIVKGYYSNNNKNMLYTSIINYPMRIKQTNNK